MKFEKSCGAVIFKLKNGTRKYLTVEYKKEPGYWGLVKGHVEPGETELETARREIHEEVGLQDLAFFAGFRTETTYSPKPGVEKLVVFFLARANEDKVEYLHDEHIDHKWSKYKKVLKKLTYANDQAMIIRAEKFLAEQDIPG